MKYFLINAFFLYFIFAGSYAEATNYIGKYKDLLPVHPRLLLMQKQECSLLSNIQSDKNWSTIHNAIIKEADVILKKSLPVRKLEGRRLLDVSREELKRIFFLSYAYRITNNKKYAERAELEMLKCSNFSDWNPTHFLDVAEMTLALAIGYDWLFNNLSATSKHTICEAILDKGLLPSLQNHYNKNWLDVKHNWSQVCHSGLSIGALAIFEEHPDIASKIINRAIDKMKKPMAQYSPDGVYPEGIGYWTYGTSFNVLFLDVIKKIFKTDFGLSNSPGFIDTGNYFIQMLSPQLLKFNYSDSSAGTEQLSVPLFWFYSQTKDSALLYIQKKLYDNDLNKNYIKNRLLPAALIWGSQYPLTEISAPDNLFWLGKSINPVCVMRSGWDNEAAYIAIKGGSPSINHGHMDIGSFIFDVNGTRWIEDLGPENYHFIESQGIDLWDMSQSSHRWNILRYNNTSHNTLTLNNLFQNVSANCSFIEQNSADLYTSINLSDAYISEIHSLYRSFMLKKDKSLIITDSISTKNKDVNLVWNICTTAYPQIIDKNKILLKKDGKSISINIKSINPVQVYIQPAHSSQKFDSQNQNTYFVRFKSTLKPNSDYTFKVEFR